MSDKAWLVRLNDSAMTIFAATASQAKMKAVKRWWDAFGKEQGWPHYIKATRNVMCDGKQRSMERPFA